MKRKTRKLIFYAALAIFALSFFTCKPFSSDSDEITYTDVVYSKDGSSLTVYLDGTTVPVTKRQSRALNLELAKIGHDYFEVAFMYNNNGTRGVARASWETGHAAGVNGVYKNDAGVNYVSTTGNPGIGQGSAILFVGKKSDKTLLAVGKLKKIDNVEVTTTAMIYTTTKSVTFEVAALKTNIGFIASNITSFWTAAGASSPYTDARPENTIVSSLLIARNPTPVFVFPENRTTRAIYTIEAEGGGIGGYINGIIVADGTAHVQRTIPRYPLGNGGHDDSTMGILLEAGTQISMTSNYTGGSVFTNPISFNFTTFAADDGKIGAFYFEIPVNPLDTGGNPGKWWIRPGYDSYLLDLDNGIGGTGGAVLYGIGDLGYLDVGLRVTKQPDKINYNNYYNYYFDPSGMITYLQSGNYRIKKIEISELTFWVGVSQGTPTQITPGVTDLTTAFSLYAPNNMLIITVRYVESPNTYEGEFVVYKSEGLDLPGGAGAIVPSNRVVMHSWLDITYLYNRINDSNNNLSASRIFIIISYFSFDLPPVHLNADDFTFIILAGEPNLIFGREDNGGGFHHYSGSTGNMYFLGVWPFNEPVSVDGMAIATYPFTIQAMGPHARVNSLTNPTAATGLLNTDGYIGSAFAADVTANLGGGVKVLNTSANLTAIRGP